MGPTLFLIYINDLKMFSYRGFINLYADDMALYNSSSNIVRVAENLNKDLTSFSNWARLNRFTINETKTKFMLINYHGNQHAVPQIKLNGVTLQRVQQ